MCFQKRLLRGSQIGAMIGRPAGHRTQREHLELYPFAIQIGVGFIPIDLCFNAPVVALRHKGLATGQSQRLFAALHILPHRAASRRASWHLCTNTLPDSLCCVALLPRSLAIRFQNRIDETRLPEPSSYAVAPSSCAALVSRSGSPPAPPADAPAASAPHPGSCLPQTHTPTESARTAPPWLSSPTPASRSKLMLKSRVEVCCVQGWAKTNRQSGPLQNAKITDLGEWCIWAGKAGIRPEIVAFLRFRTELLHDEAVRSGVNAWPTPRSWEMVSRAMDGIDARKATIAADVYDMLLMHLVQGAVGDGVAAEFIGFLNLFHSLPSIDEILLNPTGAPLPSDPSAQIAIATALGRRITDSSISKAKLYLERLPDELQVLSMRDALLRDRAIATTPEFTKFAVTHSDLLA